MTKEIQISIKNRCHFSPLKLAKIKQYDTKIGALMEKQTFSHFPG